MAPVTNLQLLGDIGGPLGAIIQTALTAFFILFIFFGQKIQMRMYLLEIDRGLKRLDFFRNSAKDLSLKTIKDVGKPSLDPASSLNVLLEQFFISPVDMDPAGLVGKFDHLLDVREDKFKDDVRRISPGAS